MKKILLNILLFSLLVGCAGSKNSIEKNTRKIFNTAFYNNQFTGFLVVDAKNNDTLYNFNGEKYFTPASVTKIFTLYSASKLLPKRIPAAKYILVNDTLHLEGNGDPTQLHPYYKDSTLLNFLSNYEHIKLYLNNFTDDKLGPGWSWDDYQYAYQVEKGSLPLYGNVVSIYNSDGLKATPTYFNDSITRTDSSNNRAQARNSLNYAISRKDTLNVPFITSDQLTKNLLEKAIKKKIKLGSIMPVGSKKVLYSVSTDSVLVRMMHQSDNFLAEQLMLLSSSTLSDSLDVRLAINHVLKNELANLKQAPRWVDGSGLSRYNLFTPESVVQILSKMYADIPRERLFSCFPAGGVSGTLEDWYPGNPEPYVYAKSGSLSNNYNLSGYLLTKSGKTLIFSFMNNHFKQPTAEVKENMQRILEQIRDNY